jgi:cell division protein FtsW
MEEPRVSSVIGIPTLTVRRQQDSRTSSRPADGSRLPLLERPLANYYLLVSAAGLLLVFGLVMVLSASSVTAYAEYRSSYYFFFRQLIWVAIGLPAFFAASRMRVGMFRWLAYPLMIVTFLLLVAVLIPGVGITVNGSTRWVGAGSFVIQPSEIAKLAVALWGADLLARKTRLLQEWKHLLIPLIPVVTVVAALIMLQPDMGTTLVIVTLLLALLFTVGAPARLFGAVVAVVVALATLLAVAEPYRLARLTSFRNPFQDAHGAGYQAVQGIYALSSGGWWGLGLGASREKWDYLPNAHTDFILAIIGEELGLVGTLVVLALFGALAFAGIRIAHRAQDPFSQLAAAAITAWLVVQAFVNMAAVVGLVPITGIPLPLISAGGSALVPTMFAIGMLASFARAEPAAAEVIALRRRRRKSGRRRLFGRLPGRSGRPGKGGPAARTTSSGRSSSSARPKAAGKSSSSKKSGTSGSRWSGRLLPAGRSRSARGR